MARFKLNRQMAIILALAACLATSAFNTAFATGVNEQKKESETTDTNTGDPDLPVGPSRGGMQVGVSRGAQSSRITIAGDDQVRGLAWVWRLRMVLQSLRAYYLRG